MCVFLTNSFHRNPVLFFLLYFKLKQKVNIEMLLHQKQYGGDAARTWRGIKWVSGNMLPFLHQQDRLQRLTRCGPRQVGTPTG